MRPILRILSFIKIINIAFITGMRYKVWDGREATKRKKNLYLINMIKAIKDNKLLGISMRKQEISG